MKRIVFILLLFAFNYSFSQVTTLQYFEKWVHSNKAGCGPSSVCAFGPNVQNFFTLDHKGIRGCPSWDDRGVTIFARNMNNGTWERGEAYSISYPFTQGFSYRITIKTLVEGPNGYDDGADGNARPYLQVQLTSNPEMYSDQLCTVSAEPIDISNTSNPFVSFHVTDPVIKVQTLTNDFYADQCYSSILFNCYPDMAVPSAGAYHLREVSIEPLGSPYEITGVTNFCTGSQTYTLNGQTNNISNITWTLTSNEAAYVTPGTTTATVTQTGNGFTRLTANWTNACGVPMSASKNLEIGTPIPEDILGMDITQHFSAGQYVTLYINEAGTSYNWSVAGGAIIGSNTESSVYAKLDNCFPGQNANNYFSASVSYQNECGISLNKLETAFAECDGNIPIDPGFRAQLSPNPVKGDLYVETDKESPEVTLLGKNTTVNYDLYDLYTRQLARHWTYKNDQNKRVLNVRGVKKGLYVLQITKGAYRQSVKVVIE